MVITSIYVFSPFREDKKQVKQIMKKQKKNRLTNT